MIYKTIQPVNTTQYAIYAPSLEEVSMLPVDKYNWVNVWADLSDMLSVTGKEPDLNRF